MEEQKQNNTMTKAEKVQANLVRFSYSNERL